jgi:hypothetical protein
MAAITVQFMAQLPRLSDFRIVGVRALPRELGQLVVVPHRLPRPLNIFRADLKGKWLAGVNLRDADAYFANLQGADLQRANLGSAKLQGADLREATGLTPAQLQAVRTDAHTQLPPMLRGLPPEGAGSRRPGRPRPPPG